MTKTAPSKPQLHFLLSPALLVLGLLGLPPIASSTPFEKDMQAFEKADQSSPPDPNQILFIGSSSIRMWKTLKTDFPNQNLIQRGFGGSQIRDSIGFAHRIILPYKPRQIVLYAGDNDINKGKSPEQVAADFKELVQLVHQSLPHTRISFIAIKPSPARWSLAPKMNQANQLIQQLTHSNPLLDFIDIYTPMLGPDGKPHADLFSKDDLHLNDKGYRLWTDTIRPYLK